MNLQRISSLIIKELQEQFSTIRGIFVIIIPVLIQSLLFPFVVTMDVTNCSVAIFNESGGAKAIELIQRIQAAPYMTKLIPVHSTTELNQEIDEQNAMIGIHIPANFDRLLEGGETASIQIISDGRRSNSSQIATGYVSTIAADLNRELLNSHSIQALTRNLYNPELSYRWFILPCIFGLLGMITSLNISTMAVAREREAGTYEQLCVTPMSPMEILTGKTIPATLIVLTQCFLIWLMSIYVYQIPFLGSLPALFCAMTMYSLSLTGIGFSISALCRTQQQAFVGMFCFVVPAILFSGFVSPAENMPDFFQNLARIDPLYYIFIVTRGIFLKGYTLIDILPQLGAFAAICLVTMLTAYTVLRLKKD